MSKTKHTPGKWTAIENQVMVGVHTSAPLCIVQCKSVNCGRKILEAKDNARLIAAAPEMLEALKQIADATADVSDGASAIEAMAAAAANLINRVRAIARDTIAKAEGRS